VALGWPQDHIEVIDTDLGELGASTDREDFKRRVAAVSMDQAGIVLGLEVSRLARNSTDWHLLLEICALTDTTSLARKHRLRNLWGNATGKSPTSAIAPPTCVTNNKLEQQTTPSFHRRHEDVSRAARKVQTPGPRARATR